MFDAGFRCEPPSLQRAEGTLRVAMRRRSAQTVLADLYQSGCLKARFPRGHDAGWADVIMLNTSGGVAAGDQLSTSLSIEPEARVTFTSQAAERFYRARPGEGPAMLRTSLHVCGGARAEWLPQESILFDGAALDRRLEIALAPGARMLAMEQVVFGRELMGEDVRRVALRDTIRIERAGVPLAHDSLRMNGDAAATLRRAAVGNGARAVATLYYVAPDCSERLAKVREALAGMEAGASVEDDLLVVRMLARDGARLRHDVIAVLAALRDRALPRAWRL